MNLILGKDFMMVGVLATLLAGCSSSDHKARQTETPPPTTATASVEKPRELFAETKVLKVVYFDFDKYDLTPESRAVLLANSEKLKSITVSIRLEGHADERGSREYNMALGSKRAQAVRDFFVLQGINAASIETVSYGEERPVVNGHDESAWSKNRRVEINY
jgi:peptidoglycan-associated lipoprotein